MYGDGIHVHAGYLSTIVPLDYCVHVQVVTKHILCTKKCLFCLCVYVCACACVRVCVRVCVCVHSCVFTDQYYFERSPSGRAKCHICRNTINLG